MKQESTKIYTCLCGETFIEPNKFNSHKNHCKIHIEQKYGSYSKYLEILTKGHEHVSELTKKRNKERRQKELEKWISEQHTCEKCGKIMTEKFGSGRFCSRQCSNSHQHSDDTRRKQSISAQANAAKSRLMREQQQLAVYEQSPPICVVCGDVIPFEYRTRKTCSEDCYKKIQSLNAISKGLGGPDTPSSFGKRGKYKGIMCDSTYELAFLIYCFDKNISVVRNKLKFPYYYENKMFNYYPDFYLPDYDTYIEIKGRDIGPVYEKHYAMLSLGLKIKLLHYEDLIPCFAHVAENYDNIHYSISSNNLHTLYDKV